MAETPLELQRFHKDTEYLQTHLEELLERYPEQWVAIYNQQVVGADASFDKLLDHLEQKGVPVGEAVVERMTRNEEVWILVP